ncbi:MAG TPA: Lpg1974 family pore-forming outer membrane protein [Chlamydiales bacterium]
MKKSFILSVLLLHSTLHSEDAASTPTKKEILASLPHGWISEEALVLEAKADRFSYGNKASFLDTSSFVQFPLNKPHAEWNPGVRINGGYQWKDWALFVNWMYIQNKAQGHKSTDTTKGFFPVLSLDPRLEKTDYITAATQNWRLNFNAAEIGVSYPWKARLGLHLKPHAALKVAFVDQTAVANYGGGIFSEGLDELLIKNNFWGIGPAIGLMPVVQFPMGFSLVGDLSASALAGRLFVKQRESYLTSTLYSERGFHSRLCWTLDAKLGLGWQTESFYKALVMAVQLGWEWHTLYDQTHLPQSQFGFFSRSEDLVLQGAYLSATLGF